MELCADRFVMVPRRFVGSAMEDVVAAGCGDEVRAACDVATGASVIWIESNAGPPAEHLQWSLRCSRFASLHHGHIARLLDFGLLGERRRFEAWRGEPALRHATARAAARALTTTYLLSDDLTTCGIVPIAIRDGGRLVALPDVRAGGEAHACAPLSGHAPHLRACGLETIPRPAVTAIAELLADRGRRAPVAVALWGEAGSGLGVAARVLARVARLNGLLPIDVSLADSRVWDAIGDRSVLLLDRSGDGRGWRRLVDRIGLRGRPHVLLLLARRPVPRVHSLQLEAVTPGDLVAAIRPHVWLADSRRVVERAAGRAAGRPARFAAMLWPSSSLTGVAAHPTAPLAAERAPEYGEGEPPASRPVLPQRTSPIPGDIATLRQKLTRALMMVEQGRHAMGIRDARGAVAALARRREWRTAVEGASALTVALTRRGQVADAQRWLADARTWADALGEPQVQGALTLAAIALHVHRGALADAEGAARGLLAAANARDDLAQVVAASAALACALFWQGRYADAADAVDRLRQRGAKTAGEATLAIAAAGAAIGLGRPTAIGLAAEAIALSERCGSPRQRAEAYGVSALASLVAGDSSGARRAAAAAIGFARIAHDPMLAIESRLLAAEALRRVGRTAAAARTIARVVRLSRAAQPASVAARVALLRELLTGAAPQAAADALAARTGLPALALFAPRGDGTGSSAPPIEDLLGLIATLQAADDEAAGLTATCVRLREALRAAAAGFVVPQGTSFRLLAADGGRLDVTTGGRACSAGQRITLVPAAGGLETGVPVNCGGRTLGALALRWNPGATPCPDRVAAWVTVASALAAPSLAAAVRGSGTTMAEEIVGDSDGMVAVRRAVDRAATAPFPVLIEGESGSGKELVARALHRRSSRRDRSFVALNCAAIPDDLLEAELFGHARGAFTGALVERPGVFEEAHGGTLFLDEVGELSPRAQAKLLRVLQEGEVRRIGENVSRRVDVRVVAATNRDLRAEVAAGRFRCDLVYRLDVVRIGVPPLRERIADLPLLVDRFWRQATDRVQSRAVLSSATLAGLAQHTWPGNVRELQNVLASLAVRAPRRGVVMPSALPWSGGAAIGAALRLDVARREFETRFVRAALVRSGGHRARAASELGLSRQGLTKLIARLAISDGDLIPGRCREPAG